MSVAQFNQGLQLNTATPIGLEINAAEATVGLDIAGTTTGNAINAVTTTGIGLDVTTTTGTGVDVTTDSGAGLSVATTSGTLASFTTTAAAGGVGDLFLVDSSAVAGSYLQVTKAGAINMTAAPNQNISLTATGTGTVNITGFISVNGIVTESVDIPADGSSVSLTAFSATSGACMVIVECTGNATTSSNATATFFACKSLVGAAGVVSRVCSQADSGNGVQVEADWPTGANAITLSFSASTAYGAATVARVTTVSPTPAPS